eukprot:bmy_07761T0
MASGRLLWTGDPGGRALACLRAGPDRGEEGAAARWTPWGAWTWPLPISAPGAQVGYGPRGRFYKTPWRPRMDSRPTGGPGRLGSQQLRSTAAARATCHNSLQPQCTGRTVGLGMAALQEFSSAKDAGFSEKI